MATTRPAARKQVPVPAGLQPPPPPPGKPGAAANGTPPSSSAAPAFNFDFEREVLKASATSSADRFVQESEVSVTDHPPLCTAMCAETALCPTVAFAHCDCHPCLPSPSSDARTASRLDAMRRTLRSWTR